MSLNSPGGSTVQWITSEICCCARTVCSILYSPHFQQLRGLKYSFKLVNFSSSYAKKTFFFSGTAVVAIRPQSERQRQRPMYPAKLLPFIRLTNLQSDIILPTESIDIWQIQRVRNKIFRRTYYADRRQLRENATY